MAKFKVVLVWGGFRVRGGTRAPREPSLQALHEHLRHFLMEPMSLISLPPLKAGDYCRLPLKEETEV